MDVLRKNDDITYLEILQYSALHYIIVLNQFIYL